MTSTSAPKAVVLMARNRFCESLFCVRDINVKIVALVVPRDPLR